MGLLEKKLKFLCDIVYYYLPRNLCRYVPSFLPPPMASKGKETERKVSSKPIFTVFLFNRFGALKQQWFSCNFVFLNFVEGGGET